MDIARQVRRYLRVLKSWAWLILLGAVLAGGTNYYFVSKSKPTYEASTTLMVGQTIRQANPEQQEIALEPRLAIDDFVVRNAAVRAGLGFTALPSMFCEEELARGELVRLLPDWSLPGGYLQAVYPHRRGLLPAVRVWIDHLAASFEACGEKYV